MELNPSIYEHAARIVGKRPWDVSRDGNLLFQAHAAAFRHYRHKPVVVGIDIYNLEAEAYGAVLNEPVDNETPTVLEHGCQTVSCIPNLSRFNPETDGRIPMVTFVAKRLKEEFPDAAVRIPVSGPYSIASLLLGFDMLLMATVLEPQETRSALAFLAEGQLDFCRHIKQNNLNIAFFESAATPPLMSPETFAEIELPVLKEFMQKAESITGQPVPCIIGGNTLPILDYILETGTKYVICPAETDQGAFMQKMVNHPEVMVRINMAPQVIDSDDWNAIVREANRVAELAGTRENVCLGTGGLSYAANPETIVKLRDYLA